MVCQTTCDAGLCGRNLTIANGCGGTIACPRCTACGSGLVLCDGDCVNLASDLDHCGACGRVCSGTATDPATCSGGACYRLASDPTNCGMVGNVCPAEPNAISACYAGSCWTRCNSGFVLCGDSCEPLPLDPALAASCASGAFDAAFDLVLY